MRRLDHVLSRVAERGDPLGADLLIDHLERKLAGEPDPIVVARQRSGIMQTFKEQTTQQPGPPTRRRGLAVAVASFIVVLAAGGGIVLWTTLDDGGDTATPAATQAPATTEVPATTQAPTTTQAPATTQAPTTTQVPPVVSGDPVGTFTFDGTTWSYDGPSTVEAGMVTFSLVNTSSREVAVFSFFGLSEDELEAELAANPVGTDLGAFADAPPIPPSDLLWLVEAGPGETVTATRVMAPFEHLIDAATLTAGATDHLWRLAMIEATEPATSFSGDAVGTFTFDGTTWSYEGPATIDAGMVTFSLVNTSSREVAVFSFFGLSGDELEAVLAANPAGTDLGASADAPPMPPSNYLTLVEAQPGESVSATKVLGAGEHVIDAATITIGRIDHLWRVTLVDVTEPGPAGD